MKAHSNALVVENEHTIYGNFKESAPERTRCRKRPLMGIAMKHQAMGGFNACVVDIKVRVHIWMRDYKMGQSKYLYGVCLFFSVFF